MTRAALPADEIFKKAQAIGQYYGFTPLAQLAAGARGARGAAREYPRELSGLALDPAAQVVAHFLMQCRAAAALPSARAPLFVWHTNIAPGRPAPKKAVVEFHALGTDRPLADALIIRAALALTRDLFREEPAVRLNSMGDKETRARYARELGVFFKRRGPTLPEACVNCAKRDMLEAAELLVAQECAEGLPAPTDHLSDVSRRRFEELLEYLEIIETPYELSHDLLSRGGAWNDTCFEIIAGGERVAWGSRYSELARHFFEAPVPAVGAVMRLSAEGATVSPASTPRARVAFVHIGDEAKRLSLQLAEEFRRARVPLFQDIGVESLTEQMHLAERRNPSYLLIMGRKEALESSAILRNRQTQEERVLPIEGIAERLKEVV